MEAVTQQELGQRIADARRSKGWTQGQLAERIGLTQTAVSRIETGTRAVGSLELADSVLGAAAPGPAPPRLGGVGRGRPSTRAGDLPDGFAELWGSGMGR